MDLGPQPVLNPQQMATLGARLATQLRAGDVLALTGDLGAGKTTLVRGICAALGVDAELVSSPTFALCNQYETPHFTIAHMDWYRLHGADDVQGAGLEELLAAPHTLCLVEWPENARDALPPQTIWLQLELVPEGRRVTETQQK